MHYDITLTVQKAWGQMKKNIDKKVHAHGLAHIGHVPLPTLQASHVRALWSGNHENHRNHVLGLVPTVWT